MGPQTNAPSITHLSEEGKKMAENIITLSEWKIARNSHVDSKANVCRHNALVMEDIGEIITCTLCGRQVSPFWVVKQIHKEISWRQKELITLKAKLEAEILALKKSEQKLPVIHTIFQADKS